MAESDHFSQESDLWPDDCKELLINDDYQEIINSVQRDNSFNVITEPIHMQSVLRHDIDMQADITATANETISTNDYENHNGNFQLHEAKSVEDTPTPTCAAPATEEYAGPFNFELQIDGRFSGKNWLFSHQMNKLFINMNTQIHLGIKCDSTSPGFYVRALMVFCDSEAFHDPVLRCLHHRSPNQPENEGIHEEILNHVLRIDHPLANYEFDTESRRRSVRVPLENPQPGTEWVTLALKFLCKNSCISGMNRRPTEVIFTLENTHGVVIGRRIMKVRVCSCPKRDKLKEEKEQKSGNENVLPRGKRTLSPKKEPSEVSSKQKKMAESHYKVPAFDLIDYIDILDYARSNFFKKLRRLNRQPTEEESVFLSKYTSDLEKYEAIYKKSSS